jgi:hypothetical protein
LAILLREWNYFRIFAAQFINQKLYDNEKDYALDAHCHPLHLRRKHIHVMLQ